MTDRREWWNNTTSAFARRDLSNTVVILPVSAVEQHGPHLPVRVDAGLNDGVLAQALDLLPDSADVLVLPPLPYGKSDEHSSFPGTLAISHETLGRLWFEIAASVHRAGARKLLFLNGHGGNIALLNIICRDIRVKLGMLAVNCAWFLLADYDDLFSTHELKHGIHGGEMETGAMLALFPDLVDMTKAEDFVPLTVAIEKSGSMLTAEGRVGFGWKAEDLHPAGAAGNAASATAENGRIAVDRSAQALVRLLGDIAAFDLGALTERTTLTP